MRQSSHEFTIHTDTKDIWLQEGSIVLTFLQDSGIIIIAIKDSAYMELSIKSYTGNPNNKNINKNS